MSQESIAKITKLQSLDDREKSVLDRIFTEKTFKVPEVAKSMFMGESTFRAILTNIYKKLAVPEGEKDKRGYVVREYSEAYRDFKEGKSQPLKASRTPTPTPPPYQIPPQFQTQPSKPSQPTITVPTSPPQPRIKTVFILVGFLVVAAVAIIILIVVLNGVNYPQPVMAATNPPQTNNYKPESNPISGFKALYPQEESVPLSNNLKFTLKKEFWDIKPPYNCGLSSGFIVVFWVDNMKATNFLMQFDPSSVSVVDDTGKSYKVKAVGKGVDCQTGGVNLSYESYALGDLLLYFDDQLSPNARYLDITFNDISGLGRLVFRKDR